MSAIGEFFHMGGYAVFVWSAYGVSAVVMALMFFFSWRASKASERTLAMLQQRSPRRRREAQTSNAAEAISGSGE